MYYLLLHYPSGHWEFPKGHIEEGEDYEKTVRREIEEETGIKNLKILPEFKKHIKYFFKSRPDETSKKSHWIFKLVTFFVGQTKTKNVKLSHEHIGFEWLPIDEAIKKTTFKNSKKLLKEANDFILLYLKKNSC